MAGKIDKLRSPAEGLMSFVGTGVTTIPDRLEDREEIRAIIYEEVEDIRVEIEAGPEQYSYFFASINKIDQYITELWQEINNLQSGTGRDDPFCRVHLGSNQLNIPDNQETTVEFDETTIAAQSVDTHGMWDANNYKMIIPRDGIYQISYGLEMVAVVVDKLYVVRVYHNVNGAVLEDYYVPPMFTSTHTMKHTDFYPLLEGDELHLVIEPLSTGASDTDLKSGASFFAVYFIRPL